ncbi:hydantoinase B/oxoprolinase family protein [Actinoallomurus sp. WRP9H-5]|nr:hydantoinase B/oxoprolinase family protein [Actinoallomurus rhizosphaericola]MCO5996675.1 hydantoinase B/oxoprolinase family protein [Actinoallomurus rhizosphaericola]
MDTSQAVTGAVYAALGVVAEHCGTMNNVMFGDDHHQYYEMVAGGSGAGGGFDGTSVVQTQMTDSGLTDPKVPGWRYPVRLETLGIRHGSGDAGHRPGGDGGRRGIRFLQPMTVITPPGHERVAPYGTAGGGPGGVGRQWVEHADGSVTTTRGCDCLPVDAGGIFVIETPDDGGYGPDPP